MTRLRSNWMPALPAIWRLITFRPVTPALRHSGTVRQGHAGAHRVEVVEESVGVADQLGDPDRLHSRGPAVEQVGAPLGEDSREGMDAGVEGVQCRAAVQELLQDSEPALVRTLRPGHQ